jgi:protein involved in polysaccharide export with SLBB domain
LRLIYWRLPLVVLAAILVVGGRLAAQVPELDGLRVDATRDELQQLVFLYGNAARSQAYSAELREQARAEMELIQTRMREGDFRAGDRIVMTVEGEPLLSDTFLVAQGRLIALPNVGQVSLEGVLRSELEEHLTAQIGRFINDPIVHARSFIRLSVVGEIGEPVEHLLPAQTPLTEALMQVGGPGPAANLAKLRIDRGPQKLWSGESLQLAIRQSRTLDELGLRDGDQITVPRRSTFAPGEIGRTLLVLSSSVVALSYIFR